MTLGPLCVSCQGASLQLFGGERRSFLRLGVRHKGDPADMASLSGRTGFTSVRPQSAILAMHSIAPGQCGRISRTNHRRRTDLTVLTRNTARRVSC